MLLKYFYDKAVAHASYLVGCQKTKEALVIDPGRDIAGYLEMAQREGMKIVAATETHIHADYVSGSRELAERTGARLYLSDEGPADWKYKYAGNYDHQFLKHGDHFSIGAIDFEVMHTPGHTPESLSFLLTDKGGGADRPLGIFTGDFVFVGAIGRPDLLEEAAGQVGTAKEGAHELFQSLQKFKTLPDYLQVWPAHGAGSACGKGMGAIPSSTVGYEKLFNPALQYEKEAPFIDYVLADQPEAPKYFAVMKRVNKEGPAVIGEGAAVRPCAVDELSRSLEAGTVVDLAMPPQFAQGHVKGTLNIPMPMLAGWAGWLVDYSKPVYLIAEKDQVEEAARVLREIGVDRVDGAFDRSEVCEAGLATERYAMANPQELAGKIKAGDVTLVDVRSDEEWNSKRIPEAEHRFLGRLAENLEGIDRTKPVVAQCLSGGRSAIGSSVLQSAGFEVINMAGGIDAWEKAGLPLEPAPVHA